MSENSPRKIDEARDAPLPMTHDGTLQPADNTKVRRQTMPLATQF
ncbi:hypothetical protein [uncultured Microbulbifer sp.]|nr:hypothetical protein [uncultured Microbulbifer sp.]